MDKLIFTVMTGAERAFHAQQVHANNLANADTAGFRADYEVAGSQVVPGYGYDSRHQSKAATDVVARREGTVRETGRDLDIAVLGQGLIAVADGEGEAYTRAGAMLVDSKATSPSTAAQCWATAADCAAAVSRGVGDGRRHAVGAAGNGTEMQDVDRLKLVDGSQPMIKNTSGLLVARDGQALPASETVRVRGGALESSNVRAVEEMVAVMDISRQFEIQMKLYQAADGMAEAGNRLLRG
jgi:flagellar basal-body rod protein FlgF